MCDKFHEDITLVQALVPEEYILDYCIVEQKPIQLVIDFRSEFEGLDNQKISKVNKSLSKLFKCLNYFPHELFS